MWVTVTASSSSSCLHNLDITGSTLLKTEGIPERVRKKWVNDYVCIITTYVLQLLPPPSIPLMRRITLNFMSLYICFVTTPCSRVFGTQRIGRNVSENSLSKRVALPRSVGKTRNRILKFIRSDQNYIMHYIFFFTKANTMHGFRAKSFQCGTERLM